MESLPDPQAQSFARTIACVPATVMRKALVATWLDRLPRADAARVIEGWLQLAPSDDAAKDALVAMAAWQIDLRHNGDTATLDRLRGVAGERGCAVVAALLDDAPPHRQLAPLGRLREISIPERRDLAARRWLYDTPCSFQRLREEVRLHPSPIMIRRVLEQRWATLRDALAIAARRPTSSGIAFEAARSERWFRHVRHREALAMNPFTPTGLALALLPTLRAPVVQHLAEAGDVHPLLASTAAALLELQGRGQRRAGRRLSSDE